MRIITNFITITSINMLRQKLTVGRTAVGAGVKAV